MTPDAAVALCLIWSAVGGSPEELPVTAKPSSLRPGPGPGRATSSRDVESETESMLAGYEAWVAQSLGHRSAAWRVGDLVAGAMIESTFERAQPAATRWTVEDLVVFLLSWFPRRVA